MDFDNSSDNQGFFFVKFCAVATGDSTRGISQFGYRSSRNLLSKYGNFRKKNPQNLQANRYLSFFYPSVEVHFHSRHNKYHDNQRLYEFFF
jgi:hypothetical protein